jgi:hypothetical protein
LGRVSGLAVGGLESIFSIKGPFLTWPLGANFDPRGRSCPPRVNFVPRGWNSLLASPSFQTVESVHPWGWTKGWIFPLGEKFTPWG